MSRFLAAVLFVVAATANAQYNAPVPVPASAPAPAVKQPTPEDIAFARLPRDIQLMLAGMTPAQALRTVDQASQQAIALGVPYPSPDQFRSTLGSVLSNSAYTSASAGASTFPPLSPLVTPLSLQR
jgi:hypothetical protein